MRNLLATYHSIQSCKVKPTMFGALLLCGLLFGYLPGLGQSSLVVKIERPSRILPERGYTTYIIVAENMSAQPINLQIIRTVNDYPDDAWLISVCSPDLCYEADVDTLDPYVIEPGEIGGAQVHILAGDTGSARVVLSFDSQDGAEPTLVELRAEIGEVPEPSLFVRLDSTTSNALGGDTVEFGIFLLNTSGDRLQPRVVRLERDYPNGTWSDFLCYFDQCSTPDQRELSADLKKGEGALFAIKMIAGMEVGESGEVEVMVDPGDGTEPTFHRFSVTVDRVLTVEEGETNEDEALRIFPNPTGGELSILCGRGGDCSALQVDLFDLMGRNLSNQIEINYGSDRVTLDLAQLPSGIYYCKVDGSGAEQRRTIIKY
ncbi:MAG: T9SS type A sorting domain-containing protein [Candidatus Kapaibacterium sp.]